MEIRQLGLPPACRPSELQPSRAACCCQPMGARAVWPVCSRATAHEDGSRSSKAQFVQMPGLPRQLNSASADPHHMRMMHS